MKRLIPYIFILFIFTAAPSVAFAQLPSWSEAKKRAAEVFNGSFGKPTTAEVAKGLKEALTTGAKKGADQASKLDGYYGNQLIRIPFPEDVKRVENTLRQMGLGSEVDKFILSLNRGAEEAAKSAAPIFVNAITQMTVQDAWGILKGNNDAATQYLTRTTSGELHSAFMPIMTNALQKTSATKYYADLVNTYNKVPGVQKVNPDLADYATKKGISGLFVLVAKEEANIRQNPSARTTDLLKKVFDERNRK